MSEGFERPLVAFVVVIVVLGVLGAFAPFVLGKIGTIADAFETGTQTATLPGAVGHWRLDEQSGTTVTDSSGNSNTGTNTGATVNQPGAVGKAYDFPGTPLTGYLTIPDSTALEASAFTLTAWVKLEANNLTNQVIISKEDSSNLSPLCTGANPCGYHLFLDGLANRFSFGVRSTTGLLFEVDNPTPVSAGTWMHLTATFNGTTECLTVNAGTPACLAVTTPVLGGDGNFTIGNQNDGTLLPILPWNGLIDDVRYYGEVLDGTEVSTVYSPQSQSTIAATGYVYGLFIAVLLLLGFVAMTLSVFDRELQ